MSAGTVYDRFSTSTGQWPDRPFFSVLRETASAYGIEARSWSYREALAEIDRLVAIYRRAGYGPGHRVGLLLENRPEFLWHWLALNAVGASIVPINPDLRAGELGYLAEHSEMAAAVAVPDRIAGLQAACPGLAVVPADGALPSPPMAQGTEGAAAECALLYTSGTTGRPKGCMLSNFYFTNTGDWYAGLEGAMALFADPPDRMLTPLPLFHVNALAFSTMAVMTIGGCLSVLDRFHPRTWWDSVREADATVIHYLGIMPPLLMGQPEGPGDRDHRVRAGFGAGIDPGLHLAAEERFGFPFVEGWAMTETGGGGVLMSSQEPRKQGTACFGRARGGAEARVQLEDGLEAATDEPGELLVRRAGPDPRHGFFSGYLKDADATAEAWAGGWLHTGDVVSRDADGDLHFIDRKKNIIRRSGENISAAEVESELIQHPQIQQVAIAPVPDEIRGEEVMALVVPAGTGDAAMAETITRRCLERLAYYKAPGWVAFVESLPVTATEKIQRGELRALVEDIAARDAAFDTRPLKTRAA